MSPLTQPIDYGSIPHELKALPQWVVWECIPATPKPRKIPHSPTLPFKAASTTDPHTWGTFDEACAAFETKNFAGMGFVFSHDDALAGVDLDKCRDPQTGIIELWAMEIVESLKSYTEISPSGTGLHIIVEGQLPEGRRRIGSLEMYDDERYFTMTGEHVADTPTSIESRHDELQALHVKTFASQAPPSHNNGADRPRTKPVLDDVELLTKARSSRNGPAFTNLWNGDISAYPSQSEADLALCSHLVFWTAGDTLAVDRLFRQSGLYREKWDENHGARTYGESTIEKAISGATTFYTPTRNEAKHKKKTHTGVAKQTQEAEREGKSSLPAIYLPDELSSVRVQASNALLQANEPPKLFRRGDMLYRIEKGPEGLAMRVLVADRLRYELSLVASWRKIVRTKDGRENDGISPPTDIVRDLLCTPPALPILNRLVSIPTFVADGTLIDKPGYHPDAKIYLDPNGLAIPPVPEKPTADDIHKAKQAIKFILQDFPFVDDGDRAHAIGLFMLPFLRDFIDGCTPLHVLEAPTAGSGKNLLVDALLIPAIGKQIAVCAEARTDDEWRKRLTSYFRENKPVLLLDNISRPLDSGVLAAALTAMVWTDRLLGRTETLTFPIRSIWTMTANNPIISTEISRRSVRIRLDPKIDRPWLREQFQCNDLRGWVFDHRADLVWAAIVLIQNWLAAGRPAHDGPILGSFEAWSRVIGGVLAHAGIPGFLTNLDAFYGAADNDGSVWRNFIEAWWDEFQDRSVGVSDLHDIAVTIEGLPLGRSDSERAVKTSLGRQLQKQRDRVIGGFRLEVAGTSHRAKQWKLLKVGGQPEETPSQDTQGSPSP